MPDQADHPPCRQGQAERLEQRAFGDREADIRQLEQGNPASGTWA